MKTENTLQLAIMRNLTSEQQAELSKLITELAAGAKQYGQAINSREQDAAISRANAAWSELRFIGLDVSF
jgi:hypothetical protein